VPFCDKCSSACFLGAVFDGMLRFLLSDSIRGVCFSGLIKIRFRTLIGGFS
jgi:hypothetical protein